MSLTDLATGSDVWSERFDGDRAALGSLQDLITARLARSLNVELVQAESRRSEGVRSRSPDAVDFAMRGWATFYGTRTKTAIARAKALFDTALHIDQDNLDATIGKAWCMAVDVINGWSASMSDDKRDAADLIDRALLRQPSNAIAHVVKGDTLWGNPEGALREYEAALEIDPNAPIAQFRTGAALIQTGRAREAFSPLRIAARKIPLLSPCITTSVTLTRICTSMTKRSTLADNPSV